MNKHIEYLYDNKVVKKKHQEFFVVYKVNVYDDFFEAERKARTIAKKRGSSLAGGSFKGNCKPYNFKTNYKVINVPDNTKLSPITAHDKMIENLIAYESGELNEKETKTFFKQLKKSGVGKSLQGHYSSRM